MDLIFILFCLRCNQHNNETRVHQEVYFMSAPHTSRRFLSGNVWPRQPEKTRLKRKKSGRSCILPNPWSCLKPNQKRSFQFHEYSTNFCETVLRDAWKCSSFFSVKLHKGTDGILLKVSRESKEEVSVYAERVTCAYFKKTTKKPTQLSSQTQMSKTSHPLLPLQQLFQLQLSSLITFPYLSPVTVPSPAHQPPKFPHPKNTLASPSLPHASFPPQPAFSPLPS